VSLDVTPRSDAVVTPARVHRRRGVLLIAIAVFQFWLWGTRISNLLRDADDATAAFVGVHLALYVAAIGVGVVLLVVGLRLVREARAGSGS
jgi:hypothetical protein